MVSFNDPPGAQSAPQENSTQESLFEQQVSEERHRFPLRNSEMEDENPNDDRVRPLPDLDRMTATSQGSAAFATAEQQAAATDDEEQGEVGTRYE